MPLAEVKPTVDKYLVSSAFIDWKHPEILKMAQTLSQGRTSPVAVAKSCFEYVRDEIKHSSDYRLNPVTCKASDVLKHQTGYCYAKSHLLAALLRANRMPAGLCYQRLTLENSVPPYCLHGLNAVYLPEQGWYRMDARGNKKGVMAEFTPPIERLAFPITVAGEVDFQGIWPEPLTEVVQVLASSTHYQQVLENLPDSENPPTP
ncbi:MAG: transglutaminase family protein [Gammaproteobacteria bacterium]|nr:transglutaminase family protein [Gammaproteobacteria bacterium]MCF6229803.1 transglutaminase family protein [Gammaproteobacteria bacterium]